MRVMFITCDKSSKVLEPADRSLDFPAATISTQFATILDGRPDSVLAMRRNQIDAATFSFLSRQNGELKEEITTVYERKNGVYVPNNIKMKFYRDDSKGYIERHIQAVNLNVNGKIDDENFSLSGLGLEYGDRMADSLTESLKVWTGDGFIDHSQFKMDNSRMPWGQGQLK